MLWILRANTNSVPSPDHDIMDMDGSEYGLADTTHDVTDTTHDVTESTHYIAWYAVHCSVA